MDLVANDEGSCARASTSRSTSRHAGQAASNFPNATNYFAIKPFWKHRYRVVGL
jgi:hypothetical protein